MAPFTSLVAPALRSGSVTERRSGAGGRRARRQASSSPAASTAPGWIPTAPSTPPKPAATTASRSSSASNRYGGRGVPRPPLLLPSLRSGYQYGGALVASMRRRTSAAGAVDRTRAARASPMPEHRGYPPGRDDALAAPKCTPRQAADTRSEPPYGLDAAGRATVSGRRRRLWADRTTPARTGRPVCYHGRA